MSNQILSLSSPRTNLILWSQDQTNSAWTKSSTTASTAATAAPDGTLTGNSIVETAVTNVHQVQQNVGIVSGQPYVWSAYLKANQRSWAYFDIVEGVDRSAYINLSTGAVGTTNNASVSVDPPISGWYRVKFGFVSQTTGTAIPVIGIATANGTRNYAGDGTSGIYLWRPQLEKGSSVTPPILTTSSIVTVGF